MKLTDQTTEQLEDAINELQQQRSDLRERQLAIQAELDRRNAAARVDQLVGSLSDAEREALRERL